jgi:hypothetical protein
MQPRSKNNNNNNNNNNNVGSMIQRCHKWRQMKKKYMDTARTTMDKIERERLYQMAEHYGRIVNEEQLKIDSTRGNDVKELEAMRAEIAAEESENTPEIDDNLIMPDFLNAEIR